MNYEQLSTLRDKENCFPMNFLLFFNLGDFDRGDFDLGDFGVGDFGIGDFDLGDFDM